MIIPSIREAVRDFLLMLAGIMLLAGIVYEVRLNHAPPPPHKVTINCPPGFHGIHDGHYVACVKSWRTYK